MNTERKVRATGSVIFAPGKKHHCRPGCELVWSDMPAITLGWYIKDLHLPEGTVWACECGRAWVCVPSPYTNVFMPVWREEKRRERRRRLRGYAP